MRIATRLNLISTIVMAALVVLASILVWSFLEFKDAKNDYILAEAIKVNFFERTSFRDQYFLYRENRVRDQWYKNKEASDRLLLQAEAQFHNGEDHKILERLRINIDESAAIFHRIVDNTEELKTAAGNRQVYEELDKRLFSQLLLKAVTVRDMATALEKASTRQIERTYRHLAIIISLFALTLALITILTSIQLGRFIRKRLAPLHDGAKIVAGGDLGYRLNESGSDEFAELAVSINTMTDKLNEEIGAHRQMEITLSDSESRLRDSILDSPDPIMIHAEDGEVILLSKMWTSITGYDIKDIPTTKIWTEKAYGIQAEAIESYIENLYGLQEVRKEGEYEVKTVSGEIRLWDFQSQPLRKLPDGRRVILSLATDITERKQAEERLRKLSTAVEQSPASVVITDLEARIQYVNPRFSEVTGYSAAEAIGENPRILRSEHTAQETYQDMWGKLTRGLPWHGELLNKRKNGELYWEETHIAPVKNQAGAVTHFVAVKTDINKRKKAEAERERLLKILEDAPDYIGMSDMQGHLLFHNIAARRMLGLADDADLSAMEIKDMHPEWAARKVMEEGIPALLRQDVWRSENALLHRDGHEIPVSQILRLHRDASGNPQFISTIMRDVSERKETEKILIQSEARMRALLNNSPYLIWQKDLSGRFIAVNKAFFNTTGRSSMDEVLGKTDFDLWPEELAKKYRADDAEVMSTRKQKQIEEMALNNGEVIWIETFKSPITDTYGNLLGTTGYAQNITSRKNAEGKIRHLAHYDPLTDLPNRTLFSDRLQQALVAAKRDKARLALMFVDLDKFKPVNDVFGHHVGDLLLKEAAKRMQDCVRESDTVARIGGDEFVVLLPVIDAEQDAMLVAEKIRGALNQPFVLVGQSMYISSSTGIAVYPEHGKDETQLLRNADVAMYYAKDYGRNNVKLYQPDMLEGKN